MFSSDRGNTSFGSVEGVGGWPGCDSREVELENRYPWLFLLCYGMCHLRTFKMFVQLQLAVCLTVVYRNVLPHYKHRFTLILFFQQKRHI
jgi:hypothetical protein